ncbi:MAG: hypothetical protein QOD93_4189, partial [Acetobacteraceae bacterium]|nr:hypothetical protein [Acetobacteraceae bacterium]
VSSSLSPNPRLSEPLLGRKSTYPSVQIPQASSKRCPEPYLEDVNLSKDLQFLIAKDADLIMLSGWIITYTRHLKAILNDRNKLIDIATIENAKDGLDLPALERQIATQATIANAEVVNAYQLFQQFTEASQKIEKIIGAEYKDVVGPKLKVAPPESFRPDVRLR